MTKNNGQEAQAAFLNKMKRPGVVVERFYDQTDLRGRNGGRAVGDYPKPSDFLVTEDGVIYYAEVKSTHQPRRFPFGQIEHGQRSAALRQAGVGGPYYFFIFSYALGKWFIMPATQFAKAVEDGAASIKFTELQEWQA